MKAKGLWRRYALGAGIVAALLGCGERTPVAPPPNTTASHDLIGLLPGTLSLSLLPCSPLSPDSVTGTIGPFGGVLRVGPHTLTVPAGALDSPVSITAVVRAETVNRVHFEPHGLTFDRSVSLTLSYANCEGLGLLLPRQVVYTTGELEILELLPSLDNPFSRRVTGRIRHFSDYAIAW